MRREMLMQIRAEEDEQWDDYEFCDGEVRVSVMLPAQSGPLMVVVCTGIGIERSIRGDVLTERRATTM